MTEKKHISKKHYFQPSIDVIELDSEISLALESEPPTFESENKNDLKEYDYPIFHLI